MILWRGINAAAPGHNSKISELDISRVRQELQTANVLDPILPDAHLQLAKILAEANEYKDAEAEFLQAVKLNPGDPDPYVSWGEMLGNQIGRMEESIDKFGRAIRLSPNSQAAHDGLIRLLGSEGSSIEPIIAEYRRWLRANYQDAEAHRAGGYISL
jgi:tetratricopeptide (TPR) repeat protein